MRDANALINFAHGKLDFYGIESNIDQMQSQSQLEERCIEKNVVCLISFLPNIYDSSAAQRNEYIKQLSDVTTLPPYII